MKKALYPGKIVKTHHAEEGYKAMKKKHLTFPGEIILQFLQDNEEGVRQIRSTTQAGATHYERTSSRKAHRNGYRKRSLKTEYGTLELYNRYLKDTRV